MPNKIKLTKWQILFLKTEKNEPELKIKYKNTAKIWKIKLNILSLQRFFENHNHHAGGINIQKCVLFP